MEKKEKELLKQRLLKMVVNEPRLESVPPITMAEVMVNSMSKPNLEPLLDFISEEIDKAKEEGKMEQQKLDCDLYKTSVATKGGVIESNMEEKKDFIWYRIKRGETLNSIARKNGIDDIEGEDRFTKSGWKVLWEFNKDLIPNPNLLAYIDEDKYADGWCINNKQGILRIPILN